jgi:sterol 14-demethylase
VVGRHRCIGEQFAYVQLKTIIATVLMNYEIELDEKRGFPENDYTSMIVMPVSPCSVKYNLF